MSMVKAMAPAVMRSKLFVPGSRPELFDKAFASAADAISFDLEDAVARERKAEARQTVGSFLGKERPSGKTVIVRTNALETGLLEADIEAILRDGLDVLNLPKIESADEIRTVAQTLQRLETERGLTHQVAILANIETPRGLRCAAEIAAADRRVQGLQLGFGDLFAPLGISRTDEAALASVRLQVRLAAAEAGIAAYDAAFAEIADRQGFRRDAEAARRLGFAGKSCVHPSQIAMANEVFCPSAEELAQARKILSVAGEMLAKGVGAFTVDGAMIDEPFIQRARAVVALAEEIERHA